MLAENALRQYVSRGSLSRGDAYFEQGRVRRIGEAHDGVIEAVVMGSRPYSVKLEVRGEELVVRCECPWFRDNLDDCKHIWATIRAASARKFLPERELVLTINNVVEPFDDDWDDPVQPYYPRPVSFQDRRPPWQRFLDALDPAPIQARTAAGTKLPEEIIYVATPNERAGNLMIQILGRTRKKSGEWGKWKPVSLYFPQLPLLPAFDRETIPLLSRSWTHVTEATAAVPPSTTAWWVERLARSGKLYLHTDAGEPRPLAWDDGPPWTLRVAIVNDTAASKYRIAATLEREGAALPFERVDAMLPDILISGGRASRFDDGGRASWIRALRVSGPVEIPHKDAGGIL